MFPSGDNGGHWPSQRVSNTILALAVTRLLISKGGVGTTNNQVTSPSPSHPHPQHAIAPTQLQKY